MRNGCVAVALVLLGATGVRADRVLTFSLPNALLLFGDYNQLRVVTTGGEQVLHPAVDEGTTGAISHCLRSPLVKTA